MSEDLDSVSSTGGELDTVNYRNGVHQKSPGKMSNKSPEKQAQQPPKSFKGVSCNVFLLDGESIQISLDKNDSGKVLFDKVCTHLDLLEKDYFGLTYTDDRGPSHLKYWLNEDKKISKQKKRGAWVFDFALKFYPPDPSSLKESLTRWLIVLQVRRDLLSGKLPCTFTTYALLGSYNVQADVGEHDGNEHGSSYDYIKDMTFAPNQTPELLEKIAELHKQHRGQTPDEAEHCFLDNSKKLSMYGVDLHKAKDSDNNSIMLGVCASGLLIYRDKLRINRFVWPKILKLSYKRNHFYIKIRPAEIERNETNIMFKLDNHRLAKRLWKTCVEHHAFFRLRESDKPSHNPTFPRFGSKFRYSGRTLYQTRQTAALLDRPPPFFERSQPNRDSYSDAANRSRSVDELAGRNNKDPYGDGMYDPNGPNYNPNDPNRLVDGRDRQDMKGGPPGYGTIGRDGDYRSDGEGGTLERRPYDSNTEDRRDRLPSQDATLERGRGHGDGSMLEEGGAATLGKTETDKERRKREKEEDKKRKKEADERKKLEDEERKRAEEERKKAEKEKKKKGKGTDLDVSEDRTDHLGQGNAMETSFGAGPGTAGLDSANLVGTGPYGVGLGVGRGDMTGVVGDESSVDNKQAFIPLNEPVKGTKNTLKGGYSDNTMPFFHPAATSTVGRSKIPPPVAPKGMNNSMDDSFNRNDPPTVATERVKYSPSTHQLPVSSRNIPVVKTQTRTVTYERDGCPSDLEDGLLITAQSHSSRLKTVETTTYKKEKGGMEEIRVEQRVVVSGDEDDDFDFDAALSDAIRSVTQFNPDMSVERIECVQQIEDVKDGQ